MRNWVVLCFSMLGLLPQTIHAQQNETQDSTSWALVAKVLPWMAVGSGVNYTLGAERIESKNTALNVTLVYNDWSVPEETLNATTGEYESLARTYFVSRALIVHLKKYSKTLWQNREAKPYGALFYRVAKNFEFHEPGSRFEASKYDEWQQSIGILVGTLLPLSQNVQLDINVGPFIKHKQINRGAFATEGFWPYDDTGLKLGLRFGVNFYIELGK